MLKFILCLTFISSISFAHSVNSDICYERLTGGLGDSALFTHHSTDVYSNDSESLDEKMAYNAITKTLQEQECKDKINLANVNCADVLNTTLCRLNMKYGYFLVLKDYVDTVNVIFNRWD